MKRLSNVSPFLLLLVPVLVVMLTILTLNTNNAAQKEVVIKTSGFTPTEKIIKAAQTILP